MKTTARALAVLALVVSVAGCASRMEADAEWNHSIDFSAYRSFHVLPARGPDSGAEDRAHASSEIRRVLSSRGMTSTSQAKADMLVRFSMGTSSRVRLSGGTARGPETAGMQIELRDATTREVLYRGWAEKLWAQDHDAKPEITQAVELILSQYPPTG